MISDHMWCKIAAVSKLYDKQIDNLGYDPQLLRVCNGVAHDRNNRIKNVHPAMGYYYAMIEEHVSINLFEKINVPLDLTAIDDENVRYWIGFKIRGSEIFEMHYYFDGMDEEPFDQFDERKTDIVSLFDKYGYTFVEKIAAKFGWTFIIAHMATL